MLDNFLLITILDNLKHKGEAGNSVFRYQVLPGEKKKKIASVLLLAHMQWVTFKNLGYILTSKS